MRRIYVLLICLAAANGATVAPRSARGADDPRSRLKARIGELEKALKEATGPNTTPPTVPSPRTAVGTDTGKHAGADTGTGTVATARERELGLAAKPGDGDPARVEALMALLEKRDGPQLVSSLGELLAKGEEGYPVLYDFCLKLDQSRPTSESLMVHYPMAFALMHLAMLHDVDAARFAHFYLVATSEAPRAFTHSLILEYIVVFLRYHKGRFPDLEADIETEILGHFRSTSLDRALVLGWMRNLGYEPKVEIFEPLLDSASTLEEATPLVELLADRNSAEAAGALTRAINKTGQLKGWKPALLLNALSRMSAPEAQTALRRYMGSSVPHVHQAATLAYFSVPRDASAVPDALDFLRSSADLADKRSLIIRLRQVNRAILEDLKKQGDRITSEEVRAMVQREGTPERKPPARPANR